MVILYLWNPYSALEHRCAGVQLALSGRGSFAVSAGGKAVNDLEAFIGTRPVGCTPISLDRYQRPVATRSADGVDLGNGWSAMALRSTGRATHQDEAAGRSVKLSVPGRARGSGCERESLRRLQTLQNSIAQPAAGPGFPQSGSQHSPVAEYSRRPARHATARDGS